MIYGRYNMNSRISITVGVRQKKCIDRRAARLGMCPTSYVSHLVSRDIEVGLQDGTLTTTDDYTTLGNFITSLTSVDGVVVEQVKTVCEILGIEYEKMADVLGFENETIT
jgi:hypothetical protein